MEALIHHVNRRLIIRRGVLSVALSSFVAVAGCFDGEETSSTLTVIVGNNRDETAPFVIHVDTETETILNEEVEIDGNDNREFDLAVATDQLTISVEVKEIAEISEEYTIQNCDDERFTVVLSSRNRLSTDHSVC